MNDKGILSGLVVVALSIVVFMIGACVFFYGVACVERFYDHHWRLCVAGAVLAYGAFTRKQWIELVRPARRERDRVS